MGQIRKLNSYADYLDAVGESGAYSTVPNDQLEAGVVSFERFTPGERIVEEGALGTSGLSSFDQAPAEVYDRGGRFLGFVEEGGYDDEADEGEFYDDGGYDGDDDGDVDVGDEESGAMDQFEEGAPPPGVLAAQRAIANINKAARAGKVHARPQSKRGGLASTRGRGRGRGTVSNRGRGPQQGNSAVAQIKDAIEGVDIHVGDGFPFITALNCTITTSPIPAHKTIPLHLMREMLVASMFDFPSTPVIGTATESSGSATVTLKPSTTGLLVPVPVVKITLGAPVLNDVPASQLTLDIDAMSRNGAAVSLGNTTLTPTHAGRPAEIVIVPWKEVNGEPLPQMCYIAEDYDYYNGSSLTKDLTFVVAASGLSSGAKVMVEIPTPSSAMFASFYRMVTQRR